MKTKTLNIEKIKEPTFVIYSVDIEGIFDGKNYTQKNGKTDFNKLTIDVLNGKLKKKPGKVAGCEFKLIIK